MKQTHVITGSGCDLYPPDSIQIVSTDENGVRWTKQGRDAIHPTVESNPVEWAKIGGVCLNCENVFTKKGLSAICCTA